MTTDDHTIDLTAGDPAGAPRNGNGHHGNQNGNGSINGYGSNGSGVHPSAVTEVLLVEEPPMTSGGELDGIEWFPSYDRDSVERHLRELDAERDRLKAEIADAERRTAEAEATLAERNAELEAGLGAVVVAARTELARIDRERDEAVAAIRAEAEAEAARIREAARTEASTVRGAASSLVPPTEQGERGAD